MVEVSDVHKGAGPVGEGSATNARLHLRSGRPVTGMLVPMSVELLQMAGNAWLSEFQQRSAAGIVDRDADIWTSGFLHDYSAAKCHPPGYAVLAGGEPQGVVLFDATLRHSTTQKAAQVLYIRYLATAPWNRATGDRARQFRGIGHLLVKQAVRESIRRGSPGRVGLHSFASAAPFFETLSFECFGADAAEQGMLYLELRPSAAFALLTDGETPSFETPSLKGVDDARGERTPGSHCTTP